MSGPLDSNPGDPERLTVKKLRGVAKPVFEARQDGGDRVLFTLARSAGADGDGLATFLQVWDLVPHDDVSATAAECAGTSCPSACWWTTPRGRA